MANRYHSTLGRGQVDISEDKKNMHRSIFQETFAEDKGHKWGLLQQGFLNRVLGSGGSSAQEGEHKTWNHKYLYYFIQLKSQGCKGLAVVQKNVSHLLHRFHRSQVLCMSGVFWAWWRHPHLSIVIMCLLLVDILLVYGSGAGVLFSWQ